MTFYYYKEHDGENIKNKVTIDNETINGIYIQNFKKYSNKRFVKFLSKDKIQIDNDDVIIINYKAVEKNGEYEISYIMYDYPKICKIIDGLLCEDTFSSSYDELLNLLVTTKQEEIEVIRKKIDREIRIFNVLLESESKQIKKLLQSISLQCNSIKRICNFDHELARQASLVFDAISVEKVNEKEDIKLSLNTLQKQKKKPIRKN